MLELGGGNSCFLDGLMQQFTMSPYVVLDNSTEGMRLARERFAPAYGDRVGYLADDVFEAEPERRFDVVFSVGLIEHFDDHAMQKLIGLHRRWAEPDGLVLIAVPTPTIFYRVFRTGAEVLGLWKFPGRAAGAAGPPGGADADGRDGSALRAYAVVAGADAGYRGGAAGAGSGRATLSVTPDDLPSTSTPTVSSPS